MLTVRTYIYNGAYLEKLRFSPAAPHARLIAQFLKIRVFFST